MALIAICELNLAHIGGLRRYLQLKGRKMNLKYTYIYFCPGSQSSGTQTFFYQICYTYYIYNYTHFIL